MGEALRVLLHRVAALFRRRRLDEDLDAEVRTHIEMAAEFNRSLGMSAEAARREAVLAFGGVEQVKDSYRDVRGLPAVEHTLLDLRFGLRMLRRNPAFSGLVIGCLALGIGATTAVFSWIEGILLRPFPLVAHQDRLVAMVGTTRGSTGHTSVSLPDLRDLERTCTLFDAFIVDRIFGTTLSVGDRAERATGSVVSSNYFEALGVRPTLGRGFEPEEGAGRNAHPVTVISYRAWKERYRGDPAIVGRTQALNGVPHTIIGVAPEGFYGTFVGYSFDFWVPASMQEIFDPGGYKLEDRGARWIEGFALLKPGVTIGQGQADVSEVAKRLESEYPDTNRGHGLRLYPLWETPFNAAGTLLPTLRIALVVVSLVLFIACANVANLLLARSFARRQEMRVRLALGAGRGRLIRQLLTEGFILSMLAGGGGLLVAYWSRDMILLLSPSRPGISVNLPAEIDWRVLALTVGACFIATLVLGLVPALQASRIDLASAMKSEGGGVVGGRGRAVVRSSLVLAQVSLSFFLLVGTGLLLKSLGEMRNVSPGFATRDVLTTSVDLLAAGYSASQAKTFQDELLRRVQALSGVESVALARITPFSYRGYFSARVTVDGYEPAADEEPTVEYNQISPSYLATTGIAMVSGREFTLEDDAEAPPVVIVNEVMAAKYWRGRDPVGQRLQVKDRWMQVVGVAKTSKYRTLQEVPKEFMYLPLRQEFSIQANLSIRTALGPETMATALAREVRDLDPALAPAEVITMREQVDRMAWSERAATVLLGVFGALALILAVIGLYGVMSYSVFQRRRELGLRMALGAGESDLLRLVLSQGLTLTAGGIALGAVAALGWARLIGNLLYQVSPRDPQAFGSALLAMAIASMAACLLPALRGMRTNPIVALRE